jgi:outer membrane protein OmpA-like peptidoglycan-associated protein
MRYFAGVLSVALLVSGCSQIVIVPPAPDGSSTALDLRWGKGNTTFSRQGHAYYIDRLLDVSYHISEEDIEAQFGAALQPMRDILATGLPVLSHSYAVLMAPDSGPPGTLGIVIGAGETMWLNQAGQGIFIDGFPDTPHPVDPAQVMQDFSPALAMQAAVTDSWRSYLVLLEVPDGSRDRLTYQIGDRVSRIEQPGQGLSLDGVEYQPEADIVQRDFAPALSVQQDVVAAGLPELPHSYAVLLSPENGTAGELSIQVGEAAAVRLEQAGYGMAIDGYPEAPRRIEADRLQSDFGPALAALAAAHRTLRSYLQLMPPVDAEPDWLTYQMEDRRLRVDQPGQGLTLDGFEFEADGDTLQSDFAPALAAQRDILAAGLPELPHSYAVLLSHGAGSTGELEFAALDASATHRVDSPGNGVFIDGYPDRPRPFDPALLQRDFGAVLESLNLSARSLRSYLILLKSPDGSPGKVVFRTRGSEIPLEQIGQSLTLDGIEYSADDALSAADFGEARIRTQNILEEGLPKLPHSYLALLLSPVGPLGEIEILEGINQGIVLDQAASALIIDGYSSKTYALEATQLQEDFADALASIPPPPVSFLLYFELGGVRLTPASRALMQEVIAAIRQRPAAEIDIKGHTDTLGGEDHNIRLSQRRSEHVASQIQASGAPHVEIAISYHGKHELAIETPDNTPELLNRRVEISIR